MKLTLLVLLGLLYTAYAKPTDDFAPNYDDENLQNDAETDPDYGDDSDSNDADDVDNDDVPTIISTSKKFVVAAGQSLELPCVMNGNFGGYVFMWKHDQKMVYQDNIVMGNYSPERFKLVKNTSLLIENIQPNDKGIYSCEIIVDEGTNVSYNVDVKTPPKITKLLVNKPIDQIHIGDLIELTCDAEGTPEPNITWSLRGERLDSEGRVYIIEKITKSDEGTYQCLADNKVEPPAHESIQIRVLHKPSIIMEKIIDNIRDNTFDVTIKCDIHSPSEKIVTWWVNNTKIESGSKYRVKVKNNIHSLRIHAVNEADFGTYSCAAENKLGKAEKSMVINKSPSAPRFIDGNVEHDDSWKVTVSYETESVFPITEYSLQYKVHSAKEWEKESPEVSRSEGHIYKLKHSLNIAPRVKYQIKLQAKNQFGWSEDSEVKEFTGGAHKPGHKKHHHNHTDSAKHQHNQEDKSDHNETVEKKEGASFSASNNLIVSFSLILVSLLFARL